MTRGEAKQIAKGLVHPWLHGDAEHRQRLRNIAEPAIAAAMLATAVAEREARDAQWRAWVTRIETDFRGSALDRATLLFLDGYPPPDRKPKEPANG